MLDTTSKPLLEVKNLCIDFGGDQVVQNLSYTLRPNKILGIVGESGSGKSVSTLALLGLLPGSANISGHAILYDDAGEIDLLHLTKNQYQEIRGNKVAMIFQEPMTSLNPLMTCGKQVSEVLQLHEPQKASKEYVLQLFDNVKLPEPKSTYDKYPHQLSGGQKQRVMIAMALACKPDVMIADEPTTALDVSVQKEIVQLLSELVDEHMSMVFISHDLGLVSDLCDDILVMFQGQKIEENTAENIVYSPQADYTKALLACRPSKNYYLEHLPTMSDFVEGQSYLSEEPKEILPLGSEVLSVEALNVYFPVNDSKEVFYHALDDINLVLHEGECLGIVGESGSGKSTIANSIIGLVKPSSGHIQYRNTMVNYSDKKTAKKLRKEMQIIFQDPYSSLNPKMKVGAAIDEVLKVNRPDITGIADRKKTAIKLLEEVGLSESDLNKYPHEFSGGQRQRIVIARALAVDPDVLICDESVSALDVSVQAQVLNLLRDLQRRKNISMLFISHDLSVVRFLCQRVIVLEKGKIVETSDTEKLFEDPSSPYTQSLLDDIPGKKYKVIS